MQVSLRVTYPTEGITNIGLVAFEFGAVRDPHELLQDEAKLRAWAFTFDESKDVAQDIKTALMDPHRGLLGKRGCVWLTHEQRDLVGRTFVLGAISEPWSSAQVMDPSTFMWTAKRVPPTNFRVPAPTGLLAGNALHEAVQQTVLLQGAFRALSLNKDFRAKSR